MGKIFLWMLAWFLCLAVCSCQVLRSHVARAPVPTAASLSSVAQIPIEQKTAPAPTGAAKPRLTLEECKRIALARNLDLQAARVDEFTKLSIRDSNRNKLLPHLVFASELSNRDNYGYAFSDVLGQEGLNPDPAASNAGTGVTNYSVGHERSTWRYSMELNWSPTDAALAYYLTKSGNSDALRAHYQKVRVAQKLVGAVEAAYFRLIGLQARLAMVRRLTDIRNRVVEQLEILYEKKLKPIEDCHRARQNSLRAARIAMAVEEDTTKQRNTLFSALILSPDHVLHEGMRLEGKLSAM
jgi:outer membrane protein TolC